PMQALTGMIQDLAEFLPQSPADLLATRTWLVAVAEKSRRFDGLLRSVTVALGETPEDLTDWATRFATEARAWLDELSALAPWREAREPDRPREGESAGDADAVNAGWLKVCRLLLGGDGPANLAEVCKNTLAALQELQAFGLTAEGEARVEALISAVNK